VTQSQKEHWIRAVVGVLTGLDELAVDDVLRRAGSETITPAGWGKSSDPIKRIELVRLLEQLSDDRLSSLAVALTDAPPLVTYPHSVTASVESDATPASTAQSVDSQSRPIFVVHGRDVSVLHNAVRVLERTTGRDIIVLHEQANDGRTILEKFEFHAATAAYAVVLLTGDDEGRTAGENQYRRRGRQNVIFELGFFFGRLGRKRVAVLLQVDVEEPSDIEGLVYIRIDALGAWKLALTRELDAAGIEVDFRRIP
jgi:predicted nucleotide-binding protein